MKPKQIEQSSFNIIDQEAGPHNFTPEQWSIVRRMIHTTADFEYQHMVRMHAAAISAGIGAIKAGKTIITDTNMARIGIRSYDLLQFSVDVKCFMADPKIAKIAGEKFAWMGAFVGFVATAIMFYYSVVAGWCVYYFITMLTDAHSALVWPYLAGLRLIWRWPTSDQSSRCRVVLRVGRGCGHLP